MTRTCGMRVVRYRNAIVTAAIAIVVLCGGRASAWAAGKGVPAPPAASTGTDIAEISSTRGTAPGAAMAPKTAEKYADRETSARDLEKFKGGDIVIIGSGGAILVLLLIIIIIAL